MDMKVTTNALLSAIDSTSMCAKRFSQCLVLIKASYNLLNLEFENEQTDEFKRRTLQMAQSLSDAHDTLAKCSKFLNELAKVVDKYDGTRY